MLRNIIKWSLIAALPLAASPATAQTYGLATSAPGGLLHALGTALSKVISEKTGLRVRVQPFGGTSQSLPLIDSGEVSVGMNNVTEFDFAYNGTGFFAGKKHPNLRLVGVMVPYFFSVAVKKDSPIQSIAALKGKRMPTVYRSQKIAGLLFRATLATEGLRESDLKGVPVPNVGRGANDFAAGKTDGFFFAIGAGKVAETSAKVGGIRFLPLSGSGKALAGMHGVAPKTFLRTLKPAKRLVGIVRPTQVMGDYFTLIASTKVSDDTIYRMTKAAYENKNALIKAHGAYRLFQPKGMAKDYGLPYHAGAIRFYKETNLWKQK